MSKIEPTSVLEVTEYLLDQVEEVSGRLDTLSLDLAITIAGSGEEGKRFNRIQDELKKILTVCTKTAAMAATIKPKAVVFIAIAIPLANKTCFSAGSAFATESNDSIKPKIVPKRPARVATFANICKYGVGFK